MNDTAASKTTASRGIDRSNPVELVLLLRRRKKVDVIRFVVGVVHYEIEVRIISLVAVSHCYGARPLSVIRS